MRKQGKFLPGTGDMSYSAELCAGRVSRTLQASYGNERHIAVRMSEKWRFSVRAFRNWYYGETSPSLHDLVKLMAECSELEAEVAQMVRELRETMR